MFEIEDQELNNIIHELLRIASILKAIENGSLSMGQRQIIHGCETRLLEIRQKMLEKIQEKKEDK